MIIEFKIEEMDKANLVSDPKHIWVDGDRIVVYTGKDIPVTPIDTGETA